LRGKGGKKASKDSNKVAAGKDQDEELGTSPEDKNNRLGAGKGEPQSRDHRGFIGATSFTGEMETQAKRAWSEVTTKLTGPN